MKKLIMFMVRRRLGLKKYENFTFVGQKSKSYYYFTEDTLVKVWRNTGNSEDSHVSLNYILSDKIKIKKGLDV